MLRVILPWGLFYVCDTKWHAISLTLRLCGMAAVTISTVMAAIIVEDERENESRIIRNSFLCHVLLVLWQPVDINPNLLLGKARQE